ncbi:uncharacterized protein TNCV_1134951 [Trichonephila clavipes]|nr:uncharacterized protein TNCV_1134951 [Trichonephila clavipes]
MCTNCSSEPATPAHILECLGLTKQDLADDPLLVLDFLKVCRTPEWNEDQTQSKPCFSSCNDLEEDLKQQPLFQDSPKDVLSDSGLEIELAIPFVPNRDPPDTPQQSELGEVVHYHPSE